jgi:hypothetical protein
MAPSSPSKPSRNPILLAYLAQLSQHPLRTKALTTGERHPNGFALVNLSHSHTPPFPKGTLCFLQEVLGSHLARIPAQQPAKDAPGFIHLLARAKVDVRAVKMALYGFLVSAPLGHILIGQLQKAFAGRTGRAAKLGQVVASNLIVSPIQTICEPFLL